MIRWSGLVIRVGVMYVNLRILRHLKEKLAWAIDERFQLISITMLFKTVIILKTILYALLCDP